MLIPRCEVKGLVGGEKLCELKFAINEITGSWTICAIYEVSNSYFFGDQKGRFSILVVNHV